MKKRALFSATVRWGAALASAAFICLAGSEPASAQRFESIFGGVGCAESGRGGVQPVSSGGYVAAGQSHSTSTTCATSDIYVVRTRDDGLLGWSMTYNIGGNDSATSIREVTNDPGGIGGFIVTGVTQNQTPLSVCLPSRDIFLLRLDSCGRVLWARTYGLSTSDEIAWDVIETRTGSTAQGTRPGDFVAAGWTTTNNGRDGYLFRVTGGAAAAAGGLLIWDRTYDSPLGRDDYFYSLDECRVNVAAGSAGDIVAVGSSNGFAPPISPTLPSYDAWLVRVNGNTGFFNPTPAPANSATYGGSGTDELRSVQELRVGQYAGNIVAVGQTFSVGGGGEAYMLQTAANVCTYVADRTLGDHCGGGDAALWVREIPLKFSPGVPVPVDGGVLEPIPDTLTPIPIALVSHIIVTGYVTPPAGSGFGLNDVFLQEFATGTLNPIAPTTTIYGSAGNDWGWSVSHVRAGSSLSCATAGYIIAGFTQGRTSGGIVDPEQLYLIKTDRAKSSGCQARWMAPTTHPEFRPLCQQPRLDSLERVCRVRVSRICRIWQERICYTADGTGICTLPVCPLCAIIDTAIIDTAIPIDGIGGHLGRNVPGYSQGTVRMDDAILGAYPNPILKGSDLMLEYTISSDSPVMISVSDIAGRVVYSVAELETEGTSLVPISTEGWASGTYTVTVNANGKATTRKVVVKE